MKWPGRVAASRLQPCAGGVTSDLVHERGVLSEPQGAVILVELDSKALAAEELAGKLTDSGSR